MAETISDARGLKIRELVEEMKLYNDPKGLEEMKKLIKKNVPFSMRGYFMAYLYITSPHSAKSAVKPEPKKHEIPEDAVSFYINIGKSSHSPAKELVAFICDNAGLSEDSIVSVAYKQNYSFVYIKKAKADKVIEKVNGQSFKGRKVKISYSKEKNAD